MPRVRLGVALLFGAAVATEIDGLRRACGDGRAVVRIAPHVTLVPPVNVRTEAVGDALAVLRSAAAGRAARGPLQLTLGPPARFHPDSETLYLAVGDGDDHGDHAGGLRALRDDVFRPPLARTLEWPFVPHVTLADGISDERSAAAVEALTDYTVTVAVDRLHLLQEQRLPEGRRWTPVADAPFERPAIVGRGGIELELWRSRLVDPEAVALFGAAPDPAPAGAVPKVVTARRRGTLVGVAHGWEREATTELVHVVVAEDHRGQGIARQLHLAFAAGSQGL